MIEVISPDNIPTGQHYAVMIFDKVTESSGWGPENDSQVLRPRYYVTQDKTDWENFITEYAEYEKNKSFDKKPYAAFIVEKKAKIVTKVLVN